MIKKILFILSLLVMQCSVMPQANASLPGYTSWNDYVRNSEGCDINPITSCDNFAEGKVVYLTGWSECTNWSGDSCSSVKNYLKYSNDSYSLLSLAESSTNAIFGKTHGKLTYVAQGFDPNGLGLLFLSYNEKGQLAGNGLIPAVTIPPCPGFVTIYGCPNKSGSDKLDRTPKKDGPCDICSKESNPFDVRNGAKVESVIDLEFPILVQRGYSSRNKIPGMFGTNWRSNFDKSLSVSTDNSGTVVTVTLITVDGEMIPFNPIDSINLAPVYNDNNQYKMAINGSNIEVTTPDLHKEIYSKTTGKILSETYKGKTLTYQYSSNGNLYKVIDYTGKYLQFTFNSYLPVIDSITANNGDTLTYQYLNGNVGSVKLNNINQIAYNYSGNLLTGKFDENNVQYAIFTYDEKGRGIENEWISNDHHVIHKATFSYPNDNQTVVTKDNGYSKSFYTDTMNYQTKVSSVNFNGFTQNATFDTNGNVTQKSNFNGVYENYTYDNMNRILTYSRDGKQVNLTYNSSANVVDAAQENSANGTRTTNFTYDSNYNILSKSISGQGDKLTYNYTYTNQGNLATQTMPNGLVTTYTYKNIDTTNASGLLASISTNSGKSLVVNSYDSRGNPTSISVNGLTKTMTYDYKGRVLTETVNGATNTYTYDIAGNMITSQMADGYVLNMTYNNVHRLLSISDNMGGSTTFTYDDDNDDVITTSINQNNNLVRQFNKVLDSLGRITKTFNATNKTQKSINYYSYIDKPNNEVDANGNQTNYGFNSRNDMTNYSFGVDSSSQQYDIDSNPTSITANNQQTTMNYDDFGRITQLTSPDTGIHNYTYDTANRTETHTDAKGTVHTTINDLNGNPLTITHTGNGVTQTENYTYNNNGSLMKIIDNSGSTTMVRNTLDQITKKTVVIGGKSFVVQYGYNNVGQMTSMTYPSGLIVNYGYTNGFLTSITSNGNNIVNNISYNSMLKEPVTWVLGGNIVTIDKDTDGLLTGFVDNGTFNQTITTDNEGHILSMIDGNSNDNFNVSLTPNYEIQSGTINGKNLYYNIGPNHNLYVQRDDITNYNYNPNYYHNKIASFNDNITYNNYNFQYDENGNTIADNKGTYTYDLKNNMLSSSRTIGGFASTGSYAFNALSQRVAKNVSGQVRYFVYNENNQIIGEYDNNGNVINEYVYFGLRPVAVKNNGNLNIVHTDYLGTPRTVTSGLNGGSMLWQWKNDNIYGYNSANGSIEFNLRFAGQYYDSESGLHYNMFRTYNPEIGRYMQSDPIGLAGGFNTYNYVNKNPLDGVDPDGKIAIFIPLIGAAAGGISNGLNYYSQGQSFWRGAAIGAGVGFGAAFIPSAAIGGAVGGIATQLVNRMDGVKLFDSGHPVKDCAKEIALTGFIGGTFGKIFGNIAEGITESSANLYIRNHIDKFNAVISNAYTTSYTNIVNAWTNVSGVLR